MSLKGYQWLNDNGEVIMYYTFKYQKIELCTDVTDKEHIEFVKFLQEKGLKANETDGHWHRIIFEGGEDSE